MQCDVSEKGLCKNVKTRFSWGMHASKDKDIFRIYATKGP